MADRCDDPLFGEIPPRILLANAPLVRVLGQVRFPKIVRIADESYIADFQEATRREYPYIHSDVVQGVELNLADKELQHRMMRSVIWRFFDPLRVIRVSLAQDAITLESASYVSRDDFLGRLSFILDCLNKTIAPSMAERAGVRYIDRLQGEDQLELLTQLIQPELLNILQPNLTSRIDISMTEITSTTAEGKLIARYGLAPANFSHEPDVAPPVDRRSWVLDVDSYSTNCAGKAFDVQMLHDELDKVAARAYAFFRWSITDEFFTRFGANQ